ncbi:hypothetical protein HSBAA_61660 [Vreelandella sulfidaeris]|uniref:Uncharacterized protein n=1 Tax=Vreelandella sulfidaeris TaxID=115553 RepID=A0A455UF77_9GAMM|nr:hypothetical protein HSBAA_61660 [Halomonas sulfidaeris]
MPNRREFLSGAVMAAAATAASPLLASDNRTGGSNAAKATRASLLPENPPLALDLFPEARFGVGGTQLGNMFRVTPMMRPG